MAYRKRASLSYSLKRSRGLRMTAVAKWHPSKMGLCPKCKAGLPQGPSGTPPRPEGPPPPVVELEGPPRGKGREEAEEEKKEPKEKLEEEEEEGEPKEGGAPEEKQPMKPPVDPEDIERAKKGSESVEREFEDVTRVGEDQLTPAFEPVTSAADPSLYRDAKFISKMNTALRDWRAGWKEVVGRTGSRFSVPDYISSRGEEPFVTTLKRSARGRKILVVADFSGSIAPSQEDYKKAIVSSMEVLDSIGSQTALYGFGGEPIGANQFFFKVKRFEDPKWKPIHSAKTAALQAGGSTPTHTAYKELEAYIKRHRPDVTVTITDGGPDKPQDTLDAVKRLKRHTRMVAFGIGVDAKNRETIEQLLKEFGYNKVFSVANIHDIPPKLVRLMAPE